VSVVEAAGASTVSADEGCASCTGSEDASGVGEEAGSEGFVLLYVDARMGILAVVRSAKVSNLNPRSSRELKTDCSKGNINGGEKEVDKTWGDVN
jgi:hypothetical protein